MRFHFWSGVGTFLNCSGASMCGGSKNGTTFLVQFRDLPSEGFWLRGVKVVFLSSGVFRDCFLVSLPVFSHVARAEKLRCPAHAAFRYDLLDSHQSLLCHSSMVPSLQPRVVLSVLQDARSCAEVAHAVLGMRSLKGGVTLWRPVRQVLPAVRCCGLLAVACKADSARYIFWFLPQVPAGHLQALLGLVLLVHSRAG